MASQETGSRDYSVGRMRLQGERRRPPGRRRGGRRRIGAPGRRVGDRWRSGIRARNGGGGAQGGEGARRDPSGPREEEGPSEWFARRCPGRRRGTAAVPGTREEGGHPTGLGRSARKGGGDAREEGGTAADHKPWEEEWARDGFTRRCQGGGEASPRVPGARGRREGHPMGLGRSARNGGGNAREEGWHRRVTRRQGGGEASDQGGPSRSEWGRRCPGRRRGIAAIAEVQGGGGTPCETYLP